ncbi:hypothetical protein ACP275_12G052800 [Erythranthe tilingii]
MSATLWPSSLLQKPQTPLTFSLLHTSPFSLSSTLRFPPPTRTVPLKFANSPTHHAVPPPYPEEDDEPAAIGDCLVFEEGIFDDPFLQNTPNFKNNVAPPPSKSNNNKKITTDVSPENLIPEKWMVVQREINISKKERRKLSQALEYGQRVEKRRQALKPLYSEDYENLKREKLQQLNPVVLDKPEPKPDKPEPETESESLEANDKYEKKANRAAPRNPRLAVYGGGLEDISALFSSGSYDGGNAAKSEGGSGKFFSKEEKMLMNKRVPDLAVATSGKWHPLHTLAASGEFYLVNALLKHNNLDINAPDKNGLTAIHKAILGKKQAIFNFLLRESANPFVRDNEGATLMHYAVFAASSQMIKILLLYNVDINLQDNVGWTPLHLAVQSRRTDVVRLLLIKGADRTLKNRDGLTALDVCLHSGRDTRTYELIKLLKFKPLPKPSK